MISVIVPVYNVEKYLDRCIESVINQTYKAFRILSCCLLTTALPTAAAKCATNMQKATAA